MKALPFILYFVDGHKATPEQVFEGSTMPAKVQFRNAQEVKPNENTEKCDGVMGAVPEAYKDYPTAQEAIRTWEKAMRDERDRLEENARKAEEGYTEPKRPMEPKMVPKADPPVHTDAEPGEEPVLNPSPPKDKVEAQEAAEEIAETEEEKAEAEKSKAKSTWGSKVKK